MAAHELPPATNLSGKRSRTWDDYVLIIAASATVCWLAWVFYFPFLFHGTARILSWEWVLWLDKQLQGYWGAETTQGETGDYLTGWLTPVALAWFALAVFLQRSELRHQRQELELMRSEYTDSRLAAQQQARSFGEQVELLTRTYTASNVWHISSASCELQLRALDDRDLTPLLAGRLAISADDKRNIFMGVIINHWATIFDIHKYGGIPDNIWNTLVVDMRGFFSSPIVQARWVALREYHDPSFREFIDTNLRIAPRIEPETAGQS